MVQKVMLVHGFNKNKKETAEIINNFIKVEKFKL